MLSVCFGVTLSDLAARPLLLNLSSTRPARRYIYRWPPLPQLQRYAARVNFVGLTYGDLAEVSGRADWREWHRIKFVTVLWLIFAGNDLEDQYYPELENPTPARLGVFARLAAGVGDFRARSPLRRLRLGNDSGSIIERKFVDGRRMLFNEYCER